MPSLIRSLLRFSPLGWISTRIRYKLLLALLAVSLVPLVGLGFASHQASKRALMEQAESKLEAIRTLKAGQVENYFALMRGQLATLAENRMTVEAMSELATGFASYRTDNQLDTRNLARLKTDLETYYTREFADEYVARTGNRPATDKQFQPLDDDSIAIQYEYIRKNAHPLGQKHLLDKGSDDSKYSAAHGKYHPVFRSFLEKFGYYDIFLVDLASSDIVYTVFKELDFTTNLKTGPYAASNIGRVFRLAAASEKGVVSLVDYEPYTPSYEDAASFIATPIYSEGRKVGVLIFQIPINRVNAIMAERTGLGETGETYAVGADFLFRNDSRYLSDLGAGTTVLNPRHKVVSPNARLALNGESGSALATNYRGDEVLSSWTPIRISDPTAADPVTWAILSEMSFAEVERPATSMFWFSTVLIAAAALVVIAAALMLARSLTRQADAITGMLSQVGMGMFDARADVVTRDELGLVAASLNSMCDNTLSLIQSQEERERLEEAVASLKTQVAQIATGDLTVKAAGNAGLTVDIADSINEMVGHLRGIVRNVQDATLQVSSSAGSIRDTAQQLSAGSAAQARQIQSTSTAVARMASAIQDVSSTTQQSANVAGQARETAHRGALAVRNTVEGMERIRDQVHGTSKRIKRLGETSQEIGEIVQLIGDIADRTSILALNASIQAAMASDAGQGFAVVAEEVERLAERANEATKRIASLIKSMQTETAEAMAAMEESTKEVVAGTKLAHEAGQTLQAIDEVSSELAQRIRSISEATREQAATADSVAKLMTEISEVTTETSNGTRKAAESIHDLAELSTALRESVSQFRLNTDRSRPRVDDDPTAALGRLVETALET